MSATPDVNEILDALADLEAKVEQATGKPLRPPSDERVKLKLGGRTYTFTLDQAEDMALGLIRKVNEKRKA